MRALIANAEREAAGIVAPQAVRDGAHRTLAEHLQTFLGDLESRGRSKTTLRHYRNVLTKLFARCRWVRFADVTPASYTDAAQLPLAADLALMPSYNIGKHDAPPDALSGVFRGRELTSSVITGQLTYNR